MIKRASYGCIIRKKQLILMAILFAEAGEYLQFGVWKKTNMGNGL